MVKSSVRGADRAAYRCGNCGWSTGRWAGRCAACSTWGVVEQVAAPVGRTVPIAATAPAMPIAAVDVARARARPTGVGELDRVLGGGLVPGSVVLLAGEPGVGKSTLLLDVAARSARLGRRVLYLTGEESAAQVRARADRIGALHDEVFLAAETDLAAVLGQIQTVQPDVLVLDSVQTVASPLVEGSAGGVAQVREVAGALVRVAKEQAVAVLLVGHVTKDGSIAGPRVLEHIVDVVLSFEGDRHSRLRLVRGVKNRFGASDEVGCFDLCDDGIVGLPDPSGLFTSRHQPAVSGTAVTVALEGRRALLAEVQALVTPSTIPTPRRTTSGLDSARVAMVLAVLHRRCGLGVASSEIYCATVGGMRLAEPATDLAVALAVASGAVDLPLPGDVVAVGEVGLAGEIRPVAGLRRRLAEAARMGLRRALVPPGSASPDASLDVVAVPDLNSALRAAGIGPASSKPRRFSEQEARMSPAGP